MRYRKKQMARRSRYQIDILLGTGDAILGLPPPKRASKAYLASRRFTEARMVEMESTGLTEVTDRVVGQPAETASKLPHR